MITENQINPYSKQVCAQYGTGHIMLDFNDGLTKKRKNNNLPEINSPSKRSQRLFTERNSPVKVVSKRKFQLNLQKKQSENNIDNMELPKQFQDEMMQKNNNKTGTNFMQSNPDLNNFFNPSKDKKGNKQSAKKQILSKKQKESKKKLAVAKSIQSIIQNRRLSNQHGQVKKITIHEESEGIQKCQKLQKLTSQEKSFKIENQQKYTQTQQFYLMNMIDVQAASDNEDSSTQRIRLYKTIIDEKNEQILKYQKMMDNKSFKKDNSSNSTSDQQLTKLKRDFIDYEYKLIKCTQLNQKFAKQNQQLIKANQKFKDQIDQLVKQKKLLQQEGLKYCQIIQQMNENIHEFQQKIHILQCQIQHNKYLLKQQKEQKTKLAYQKFNLISKLNIFEKEFKQQIFEQTNLIQKINRLIHTVQIINQKLCNNHTLTQLCNLNECLSNIANGSKQKFLQYNEKIQYISHLYKQNLTASEQLNKELIIQLHTFLSEIKLFETSEKKLRESQNLYRSKTELLEKQLMNASKILEQQQKLVKSKLQQIKCDKKCYLLHQDIVKGFKKIQYSLTS